ncbi:kinase-like domain-containing protein [Favolaschia claudopus]|uniref:Kinase-like domain-containing protein n=1 Tax=Favolaschia claudopus TaxID=2862362 RepID=A0AAV9ZE52_9AGAR
MHSQHATVDFSLIPDNWAQLSIEQAKGVWDLCVPFLRQHGIILFGYPGYRSAPLPPRSNPRDAFHPSNYEDFVNRLPSPMYPRVTIYTPYSAITYAGIDAQGRNIFIKVVPQSSNEWRIIQYLSKIKHAWNHTIPLLSLLRAGKWVFIIQPLWDFGWDLPPCDTAGARLRMAKQLIEGLCFMHMCGVAHNDIHDRNILINHDNSRPLSLVGFRDSFKCQLAFIDFEFSFRFPKGSRNSVAPAQCMTPPNFCPPERVLHVPTDMFAGDVYSLGRVLQEELQFSHSYLSAGNECPPPNMEVTAPAYIALLGRMTAADPRDRPTALEALQILNSCEVRNV